MMSLERYKQVITAVDLSLLAVIFLMIILAAIVPFFLMVVGVSLAGFSGKPFGGIDMIRQKMI